MTDTSTSRGLLALSVVILIACAALAYGVIAFDVKAIAALGVLLAIVGCATWPFVGLLALVGTVPIEALATGDGSIPTLKGLAAIVAGAWGVRVLLKGRAWPPRLPVGCNGATVVLIALAAASAMWAMYPGDVLKGVVSLLQLVVLGVIVADMALSWNRLDRLISFLVFGGVIAAVATIGDFYLFGAKRAGDGIAGGINGTAAVLVSILPFAPYVAGSARSLVVKSIGFAYMVLAPVAVMVTFSRSAWLMLLMLTTAFGLKVIKHNGVRGMLAVSAAMILLAAMAPKDAVVDRAASIVQVITAAQDDASGVEDSRSYHYEVGREMLSDAPFWGVGYNNYPRAFRYVYQFRVPGSRRFYSSLRSPHSTYVGIGAELGAVGIVCWLSVMGMLAAALFSARNYLRSTPGTKMGMSLRNAALAALVTQAGFCLTTTVHMTKMFWIVAGIIYAIGFLSRVSYASFYAREATG